MSEHSLGSFASMRNNLQEHFKQEVTRAKLHEKITRPHEFYGHRFWVGSVEALHRIIQAIAQAPEPMNRTDLIIALTTHAEDQQFRMESPRPEWVHGSGEAVGYQTQMRTAIAWVKSL